MLACAVLHFPGMRFSQLAKKGWFESRPPPAWTSDPRAYQALQTTAELSHGPPAIDGIRFCDILHGCAAMLKSWSEEPAGMSLICANELAALLGCLARGKLGYVRRAWSAGGIVTPVRTILGAAIACQVPGVRIKLLEAAFRIIRATPASVPFSTAASVRDRAHLFEALKAAGNESPALPQSSTSAAPASSMDGEHAMIAATAEALAGMPARTFKTHARAFVQAHAATFGASEAVTAQAATIVQDAATAVAPARSLQLEIGPRSVVLAADSDGSDALLAVWGQDTTVCMPHGKGCDVVLELQAVGYTCATIGDLADMRPPCPRVQIRLSLLPAERRTLQRYLTDKWTSKPGGQFVCPFTCPSWPAEPRIQRSPSPDSAPVAPDKGQPATSTCATKSKRTLAAFSQADSPERPSAVVAGFAAIPEEGKHPFASGTTAPLTHAAAFVVTRDELRQRLGLAGLAPSRPVREPPAGQSPIDIGKIAAAEAVPAALGSQPIKAQLSLVRPESAVQPRRIRFEGSSSGSSESRNAVALLYVPRNARPQPLLLESLSIDANDEAYPGNPSKRAISPVARTRVEDDNNDNDEGEVIVADKDDGDTKGIGGQNSTERAGTVTPKAHIAKRLARPDMPDRRQVHRPMAAAAKRSTKRPAINRGRAATASRRASGASSHAGRVPREGPSPRDPMQQDATPTAERVADTATHLATTTPATNADASSAGQFVTVASVIDPIGAPHPRKARRRSARQRLHSPVSQCPSLAMHKSEAVDVAAKETSQVETSHPVSSLAEQPDNSSEAESPDEAILCHPKRRASMRAAAAKAAARIAEQVVPSQSTSPSSLAFACPAPAATGILARATQPETSLATGADSRDASPASLPGVDRPSARAASPTPAQTRDSALAHGDIGTFALSTPLHTGLQPSGPFISPFHEADSSVGGRELVALLRGEIEAALVRVRDLGASLNASHAELLKHHHRQVAALLAEAGSKAGSKLQAMQRKGLAKCDATAQLARSALAQLKQEAEAAPRAAAVRAVLADAAQLRSKAAELRRQAVALDGSPFANAIESAAATHAATRRKRVKRALQAASLSASSQPIQRPTSAHDALRSLLALG